MRIARIAPGPGQESVWDYPRPPRLETTSRRLRVEFGGAIVADTTRGFRILETSHPPVYYIPPEDIAPGALVPADGTSYCEFKGRAIYFDLIANGARSEHAAWAYPVPAKPYLALAHAVAFYATKVDACYVDDERVAPQAGDFYGGWITRDVVGPFKGAPGTRGW